MRYERAMLAHLPRHQKLVAEATSAFADLPEVRAMALVGSLAAGRGDRVSDADIVIFTSDGCHDKCASGFAKFQADKEVLYCLNSQDDAPVTYRKYVFGDFTSAELHCLDLSFPFALSRPYRVLIDKDAHIPKIETTAPPIAHADFPPYENGDAGLIWELVDCIKWLSRGDTALAKTYIARLGEKLSE